MAILLVIEFVNYPILYATFYDSGVQLVLDGSKIKHYGPNS
jgi:hypothetical protein